MTLDIDADELDYKIQEAYDNEEYAKANELSGIKKNLFGEEED